MAWVYKYDTSDPDGDTKTGAYLDDIIKNDKKAMQERLNADHLFPLTGTQVSDTDAGKHRKVTAQGVLSAKPTLSTGEAALYTKTVDGVSEWFSETSDGLEKQLTSKGALNVALAEILGLLTNDTYWTSIDAAGTGTVNLIKANTSDGVTLGAVTTMPDTSQLTTSGAPAADAQIANKKYVDDSVASTAKYVSAWTTCSVTGTYTLSHGLGTDEFLTAVQFKDTANFFAMGADRVYQINQVMYEDRRSSLCVTNITSTQLTIQAGANHVAITFNTSGALVTAASGKFRVIAW